MVRDNKLPLREAQGVMKTYYTSKREGLKALRAIRKTNPAAKLYRESRTYTVPFRGIEVSVNYFIQH